MSAAKKTDLAQHEADRLEILQMLVAKFEDGMTYRGLQHGLTVSQISLDDDTLRFHLEYLRQKGFVELEAEERRGRKPRILRVRATVRAVDYVDERIPREKGIA